MIFFNICHGIISKHPNNTESMSEQIRRQFTLSFPVERVKKAIEDACTGSGGHQIKNRNPAFGTYNIALVRMLNVLAVTVTVKAASDTETAFELSAMPGPQLSRMPSVTTSMIEDFLSRVGGFASGQYALPPPAAPLTPEQQEQKRKRESKAIVIMLIILAAIGYGLYKLFTL
jgi:hypothetical protein